MCAKDCVHLKWKLLRGNEMSNLNAAPFVKWAGGKRQLLSQI